MVGWNPYRMWKRDMPEVTQMFPIFGVVVTSAERDVLQAALAENDGVGVFMHVKGSGHIDQGDRQAVVDIYNQMDQQLYL